MIVRLGIGSTRKRQSLRTSDCRLQELREDIMSEE